MIEKRTSSTKDSLEKLKLKLSNVNKEVFELEKKENPKYLQNICSKIEQKEKAALEIPKEVQPPTINSENEQNIAEEIKIFKEKKNSLLSQIDQKTRDRASLIQNLTLVENLKSKITAIENSVKDFNEDNENIAQSLGINLSKIPV